MQISKSFRPLIQAQEDLPAMRAAVGILVILLAFLLNVGFFASLLVIEIAVRFFAARDAGKGIQVRALLRPRLLDITLLLFALTSGLFLRRLEGIFSVHGWMLASMEIFLLVSVTLPKLSFFKRFIRRVHHADARTRRRTRFQPLERLEVFICILSTALLVFSPLLLHADLPFLLRLAAEQIVPWRL